jgi:hypothetical protein
MWLLGRLFGGGGRPLEDLESLYRSSAAAAIEADQEPLRFELDYASWLTAARQYRSGSHRSEERVVDDLLRLPVAFHAERAGTHRYRWGDGLRRAECFDAFALGFRNSAVRPRGVCPPGRGPRRSCVPPLPAPRAPSRRAAWRVGAERGGGRRGGGCSGCRKTCRQAGD